MSDLTYTKCGRCMGTGVASVMGADGGSEVEDPCGQCNGNGYYVAGFLKPQVVHCYEISDALDTSEYNALSDAQKNRLHVILSMGLADLSDGTNTRTQLLAMFDSESTTRANILALIS